MTPGIQDPLLLAARGSADYQAFAAISDIADHRTPRKKIVFRAIDLSGGIPTPLAPLGSSNPATPLVEIVQQKVSAPQIPKMELTAPSALRQEPPPAPAQFVEGAPVSQVPAAPTPPVIETTSLPARAEAVSPPARTEIIRVPTIPEPQKSVVFVGDVMDMTIPCFDVSLDEANGFLGLVVKVDQPLKLKSEQKVVIRANNIEGIYWFTGISVPITVLGATALVFGITTQDP